MLRNWNSGVHNVEKKPFFTAAGTRLTATIPASKAIGLSIWSIARRAKEASRRSEHHRNTFHSSTAKALRFDGHYFINFCCSYLFLSTKRTKLLTRYSVLRLLPCLSHKLVQHTVLQPTLYNLMRSHLHFNKYILILFKTISCLCTLWHASLCLGS